MENNLTLLFQLFKLLLFQIELIGEARGGIQSGVGLVEVHLTENREPLEPLKSIPSVIVAFTQLPHQLSSSRSGNMNVFSL